MEKRNDFLIRLWRRLNSKYATKLRRKGYSVKNKEGDFLVSSHLLNFIMYFLYVIATCVVIWYDSSGPPSIATIIANFFVIIISRSDRQLQRKIEITTYLEKNKAKIIYDYNDVMNKVREGQIYSLGFMAAIYAAGFLGYIIVVYYDKIDTNSIDGALIFMKGVLTFSIISTLYDKWMTMSEGVFRAIPSSYVRQ